MGVANHIQVVMGKVGKHNKPSAWAARSFKELMYGFETLKHDREEPAN